MKNKLKLKNRVMSPPGGAEAKAEPPWAIATLYPAQGRWSEEDYLSLPTNHLVELSDGSVEVLPMPTPLHQMIVSYLHEALQGFVRARRLGRALPAPVPVKLWPGKHREPDVVFVRTSAEDLRRSKYLTRPDLVVEVVSPEDPERDWITKLREYPKAGVKEYWIVDPRRAVIAVYTLQRRSYKLHGEFRKGQRATSRLLEGFSVAVEVALAGGE
ncbi:MAG: Uma2 family endonuclease [Planctomycetes bacterium]|nr:Uma2 family endonuclease [Planctomycetota bacterium]